MKWVRSLAACTLALWYGLGAACNTGPCPSGSDECAEGDERCDPDEPKRKQTCVGGEGCPLYWATQLCPSDRPVCSSTPSPRCCPEAGC